MFVQDCGSVLFLLGIDWLVFTPDPVDPFITALCHRSSTPDVLCLLPLHSQLKTPCRKMGRTLSPPTCHVETKDCYWSFYLTCTTGRPPLSTCRSTADELPGDSFIPKFRLMIVSCRSSVAAVRFSALESTASLSSHSFSIRSQPRLAIRTARLMCSAFSRSIQGCKSAITCLARAVYKGMGVSLGVAPRL